MGNSLPVSESVMDVGQRKKKFSGAYLQAICSMAGMRASEPDVDDDSVDWQVVARGQYSRRRSPHLDVQAKCKEVSSPFTNGLDFSFQLSGKNYDDLRGTDLHVPRILLVVLVPQKVESWLKQSDVELSMKYCGYWLSLRDHPERNTVGSPTVRVPYANRFSVDAIQEMMRVIGDGGVP